MPDLFHVRPAVIGDAPLLQSWIIPENTEPGTFYQWLTTKIGCCDAAIVEIESNSRSKIVSMAYLENDKNFFFSTHPGHRGKGLSKKALRLSADFFIERKSIDALEAAIPRENTAAIRVFAAAKFRFVRVAVLNGKYCQCYTYTNTK